jgi:hypothetical protein
MKPLDKALLTQELSELMHRLKDGNLSYFDHARSKQRILEIQQLCAHVLQQKSLKQQQLEPLLYAQDFVYQSRYREFCCGVFCEDSALEDILYQQAHSTWALLYEPAEGWQIWLLQMPNQTLLISDSGALEAVYAWLVTQQMKYQCFNPSHAEQADNNHTTILDNEPISELKQQNQPAVATDSNYNHSAQHDQMAKIDQATHIPVSHLPDIFAEKTTQHIQKRVLQQSSFDSSTPPSPKISRLLRKQETDISEGLSFDLGLEPLDLDVQQPIYIPPLFSAAESNLSQVHVEPSFEAIDFKKPAVESGFTQDLELFEQVNLNASQALKPSIDTATVSVKKTPTAIVRPKKPETVPDLVLQGYPCQVSALLFEAAREKQLYRITPQHIECQHVDLLLHLNDINTVFQQPIYLAEQIDAQGRFVKYLALFGAQGELQAIRLAHIFSHAQGHKLVAVSRIDWPNLEQNLFDFDALFHTYDALAQSIWSQNQYYPYIPVHLIQTQKFIQFIETPATTDTPLLLLKERQKIRVIHGDQRLNLALNEIAYPYLLLDRQQGISWQLIQEVIQTLPQPIEAVALYEAICLQAS